MNPLAFIARHTTWMLAGGVFAGIFWQPMADALAPWLEAFIVMNLTLSMIRIEPSALKAYLQRPGMIATIFIFTMVAAPLAIWVFARATGIDGSLGTGMVFHGLATPFMSAPALCLIFGLDAALALIITVMCYALVPFTLPPLALWLLGIELDVTVGELMWRLGRIVGASFLLAIVARRLLGSAGLARLAAPMDGLMVLGMVGVAVSLMSGLPEFAAQNPVYTAIATGAAFATNIVLQIAGAILFLRLGRRAAITVGLMTGNTNVALVLAAVSESASYDLLVYFVVGQFPIYILPLVALPIYRRLVRGT